MVVAVLLLALSLAATGWSALRVVRSNDVPGRVAFGLALLGTLWWACTTLAQVVSPNVGGKILASELAWLGNASAPLYWALSIYAYVRGRARESRFALCAVALFACGATIAALTTDVHHAVYARFEFVDESYGVKVIYRHGWLFWAIIVVIYTALLSGVGVSLWAMRKAPQVHRRQVYGMLGALAVPWVLNALAISAGFSIYGVDPEPFGFVVSGAVLAFLFGRDRLFAVAPIAGEVLFEAIPDPVIAIDGANRILGLNSAARRLPGTAAEPIGAPLTEPAELVAALAGRLATEAGERFEIGGSDDKSYEAICRPLAGWVGGRLLLLRDVTESRKIRKELLAKSGELQRRLELNEVLERRLRHEAEHDHLTGLYSRRMAWKVLPRRLEAARAEGRTAAVALLDIDHFKLVNDRYGHQAGDEVLQRFAATLQRDAGRGECAFRYGGEEFLVFLPDATADDVVVRCVAWRAFLAATQVPRAPEAKIAFSAGVAVMPEAGRELDELVRAADIALYRAKSAGRNRAVVWDAHADEGPEDAFAPLSRQPTRAR